MSFYNENSAEIKDAYSDLKSIISGVDEKIDSIQLFGSTLLIPIEESRDIDFFISYKNIEFEKLRSILLESASSIRPVVIENHEGVYKNCPSWERTTPHTIHIILYRKGASSYSEKLIRTMEKSIDVTKKIITV